MTTNPLLLPATLTLIALVTLYSTGHWIGGTVLLGYYGILAYINRNDL